MQNQKKKMFADWLHRCSLFAPAKYKFVFLLESSTLRRRSPYSQSESVFLCGLYGARCARRSHVMHIIAICANIYAKQIYNMHRWCAIFCFFLFVHGWQPIESPPRSEVYKSSFRMELAAPQLYSNVCGQATRMRISKYTRYMYTPLSSGVWIISRKLTTVCCVYVYVKSRMI